MEKLCSKLLPQFSPNFHGTWHRCVPWDEDVQDRYLGSSKKVVAMVTTYYGQNKGQNCFINIPSILMESIRIVGLMM